MINQLDVVNSRTDTIAGLPEGRLRPKPPNIAFVEAILRKCLVSSMRLLFSVKIVYDQLAANASCYFANMAPQKANGILERRK